MARNRGRHAAQRAATAAAGHRRRSGLRSTRYRRGLGGTAIAAVVMAALTASQAPGVELGGDHHNGRSGAAGDPAPGDDSYETELPPLESPHPPGTSEPGGSGDKSGIPASVLAAYKKAAKSLASRTPGCGLRWELLAGIGKVESGHARGGAVDKDGTTLRPILGPVLNGEGFANIKDTDGGRWDSDSSYDRAVGPLQFIPSTWNRWGADGNGDGRKDPNNVHDAALAAGDYLCAGGRDLSTSAGLDSAILSYNNSSDYLRTVLAWYEYYRKGTHAVPDGDGSLLPTAPGVREPGGGPDKGSPGRGGKGPGKGGGHHSNKPGRPGNGGGGNEGGGGHENPSPSPSPEPAKPHAIERVGAKDFTAVAGEKFAARPAVKAETSKGTGVKGVKVRFEIRGETDATFEGGARTADVTTNADGVATAPTLSAGSRTGSFTVRATAPGKDLGTVDFAASVTAPQADKLARTSDVALEADKNAKFAQAVEVKATRKGKPVAGTTLTAALDDTAKGPYFKDEDGKPVRSLAGLKTDANGVVKLPDLFADDQPGTYTLTLKADGGATLKIQLTIKG
ncbi:lytic murein transglycosylase [Streptomyces oryzae]|uniref:Lytic murein transglycosylase n=1 Tax=Streptomyces oryzae TaxID=1434886 RepID=A0ABS3XH52_9ACTN|nr:lytic murein transglycosylase [Streptomyces oryzae]MBO8194619.1 lytic murein transglycosylase [Streptomyces oryzae]